MIMVTEEEIRKRQELTAKLDSGELGVEEAKELKRILEAERIEAQRRGDTLAVLLIALLLIAVIAILSRD